jgi:hypothetical protein
LDARQEAFKSVHLFNEKLVYLVDDFFRYKSFRFREVQKHRARQKGAKFNTEVDLCDCAYCHCLRWEYKSNDIANEIREMGDHFRLKLCNSWVSYLAAEESR